MTLQEFINKYSSLRVGDGQCGTLVRQYWIDVDHTTPPSYPNSKDYWFNPVPGYDKVHDPQPGDIAIYDGHGIYTEGHSAIYVDGRVFEQNADPDGAPAHVFNRANTYLLGYLRKQGASMPTQAEQIADLRLSRIKAIAGVVGVDPNMEEGAMVTAIQTAIEAIKSASTTNANASSIRGEALQKIGDAIGVSDYGNTDAILSAIANHSATPKVTVNGVEYVPKA